MRNFNVVITDPTIGELAIARGIEEQLGVRIVTEPFILSEQQRQLRRTSDSADKVRPGEPNVAPALKRELRVARVTVGQDLPLDIGSLAPDLELIQVLSSGVEHLRPCSIQDTTVIANAAGIAAESVAEWVLAQILLHLKNLRLHARQQEARIWKAQHGKRLRDKRVVIVGLGAIGYEAARVLLNHGMRVTGVRRTQASSDLPGLRLVSPRRLHEALSDADIVVATLPDTQDTKDMFDRKAFASMPQHALFINVGRGSTVDEDALCAALRIGQIAAASLDVVREEPLPVTSPMWGVPNLVISPHSAVSFEGIEDAVLDLAVDNIRRLREGGELRNVVVER